jgi:hypothetical protein
MEAKSKRDEVIEVTNKLFIYTDYQQWDKLLSDVFTKQVYFDMESAGGGKAGELKAQEICNTWKKGFEGLDSIHHQAGNYIIKFDSEEIEADIVCYAIAIHYKNAATQGKTREFVGSYELRAVLTDEGWRLSGFKYNLKYISGNADLT